MKKDYEIILLDIDDTIFDYRITEDTAMKKVFEDFKFFDMHSEEDYKAFRREYKDVNRNLWDMLEKGEMSLDRLKTERFQQTFDRLNMDCDGEKYGLAYIKRLGESVFLFTGAEELLKYMYENYKVVVITNGIKEVQIPRIKNSAVSKYTHEVVISDIFGVSKPNPEIFQEALNKIGYEGSKEKVIMIGDSLNADIKGANNFGIDSCWVNIVGRPKIEGINPTYSVESYQEIYEII